MEDRTALENVCGERLPQGETMIVAGVYQDDGVKSLVKSVSQEAKQREVWLETVFHGNYLKMMRIGEEIVLKTDSQEIKRTYGGKALAVLNESGFVYFTVGDDETEHTVIDILNGMEFDGFWDEERLKEHPIWMKDVFNDAFADMMMSMDRNGSSIL